MNKSVTYSSKGSQTSQINFTTDFQIAARRNNVIRITLLKFINIGFLNQIRYFLIK